MDREKIDNIKFLLVSPSRRVKFNKVRFDMKKKMVTGIAKLIILLASELTFDAGIKNRMNQGRPVMAIERDMSDFQVLPIVVVEKLHITCGKQRINRGPQTINPCTPEV